MSLLGKILYLVIHFWQFCHCWPRFTGLDIILIYLNRQLFNILFKILKCLRIEKHFSWYFGRHNGWLVFGFAFRFILVSIRKWASSAIIFASVSVVLFLECRFPVCILWELYNILAHLWLNEDVLSCLRFVV